MNFKEELYDGLVVKLRNGSNYLFLNGVLMDDIDYIDIGYYNDDLKHISDQNLDIMEIHTTKGKSMDLLLLDFNLSLLWKRVPYNESYKLFKNVCAEDTDRCVKFKNCDERRASYIYEHNVTQNESASACY